MNCRTCAHWDKTVERVGPLQFASRPKHFGFCLRSLMRNGDPTDPNSLAYSYDVSHYAAVLMTDPSFACLQFEQTQEGCNEV